MNVKQFLVSNKNTIGLLIIVAIIVGGVYMLVSNTENFGDVTSPVAIEEGTPSPEIPEVLSEMVEPTQLSSVNSAPVQNFVPASVGDISPEDLLPKSQVASEFADQFPVGTGDLTAKNFMTAGFNVGINTVSSSLRNANLQLRSDPYIPTDQVGPWNQSTMIPDLNRKQMEIGSTC